VVCRVVIERAAAGSAHAGMGRLSRALDHHSRGAHVRSPTGRCLPLQPPSGMTTKPTASRSLVAGETTAIMWWNRTIERSSGAPIPYGASRRLRPPNVPWRVSSGLASMGWSSTSPTPDGMGHPDGLRREKTAMAKNGRGAWSSPALSMMGSRSCVRSPSCAKPAGVLGTIPRRSATRRQSQGARAAEHVYCRSSHEHSWMVLPRIWRGLAGDRARSREYGTGAGLAHFQCGDQRFD
jgi:hypothetical protein